MVRPVAPPSPTWSEFRPADNYDWEDATITEEHPTQPGYPPLEDVIGDRNISMERVIAAGTHSTRLTGSWHVENLVQRLSTELPDVTGDLIMEMVDKKLQDAYVEAVEHARAACKPYQFSWDLPGSLHYHISCIDREPSSLAFANFFGSVFRYMDLSVKPEFARHALRADSPELKVEQRQKVARASHSARDKFGRRIRPTLLTQFGKITKAEAKRFRQLREKPKQGVKRRLK